VDALLPLPVRPEGVPVSEKNNLILMRQLQKSEIVIPAKAGIQSFR
jgi:hypothetical protein